MKRICTVTKDRSFNQEWDSRLRGNDGYYFLKHHLNCVTPAPGSGQRPVRGQAPAGVPFGSGNITHNHAPNSGFTLTEMAIVLAIAGLVISGIWVAASMYYTNLRLQKAQQQIMTMVTNIRAHYADDALADPGMDMANTSNAVGEPGYILANIFPKEMVQGDRATGFKIYNVWKGGVQITSAMKRIAKDSFAVNLYHVPQNDCRAFVNRLSMIEDQIGEIGISWQDDNDPVPTGGGATAKLANIKSSTNDRLLCSPKYSSIGLFFLLHAE